MSPPDPLTLAACETPPIDTSKVAPRITDETRRTTAYLLTSVLVLQTKETGSHLLPAHPTLHGLRGLRLGESVGLPLWPGTNQLHEAFTVSPYLPTSRSRDRS